MELYQAILIALFGYLAAECVPWLMGDFGGYYVLSKPLASGLIVGLILGDVKTGVMVGAAVQRDGKSTQCLPQYHDHYLCRSNAFADPKYHESPFT